jgi:Arc/MetJ-type ribon-helix-helix transcriptional regulator
MESNKMVRMQILLDEKHKKLAKRYAKQLNKSESEVIRRALDAFDPQSESEIEALLAVLQETAQRAEVAVNDAIDEVTKTTKFYRNRKTRSI